MAKAAGRLCVIKKNAVTIAGGRTVGITWNGSGIDVTDQNDNGVQEFLDNVTVGDTLELTIEGVEEDNVLRDIAFTPGASKDISDLSFVFPNGDTITGTFRMNSYAETGAYEDAQTFNATFVRNRVHTYTPSA
ncbi:phage tail protein [Pontitalea aquivivens]|uniref:hypothetical protein n=1 Tax=Pontitalea aquivivens TaxID=3388663 RepID=UPI0039706F1A